MRERQLVHWCSRRVLQNGLCGLLRVSANFCRLCRLLRQDVSHFRPTIRAAAEPTGLKAPVTLHEKFPWKINDQK